jgi:biopolymer transport protein ExbD
VRIDGDTRVPYRQLVHLLDPCQFEGLTRVSLRTRTGR